MTGLGRNLACNPELYEHFGIAVCEAMSAGVVPLALAGAGPAEILTDGVNGLLIADAADLISRSADLLATPSSMAKLREAAVRRASDFKPESFAGRFAEATERLCSASRATPDSGSIAAE